MINDEQFLEKREEIQPHRYDIWLSVSYTPFSPPPSSCPELLTQESHRLSPGKETWSGMKYHNFPGRQEKFTSI